MIVESCSFILVPSSSPYHTSIHIFISSFFLFHSFPGKKPLWTTWKKIYLLFLSAILSQVYQNAFIMWLGSRGFGHNQLIVHDYYSPLLLIIGNIVVSSLLLQSEASGPQLCSQYLHLLGFHVKKFWDWRRKHVFNKTS